MVLLYLYDGIMDVMAGKVLYPKSLASHEADHQYLQDGTSQSLWSFFFTKIKIKRNKNII